MNPNKETGCLLVLDDEAAYRQSLADMLRGEGYRVFEAVTVEEARGILRAEKIELALVDYMLKNGHEGIELLDQPVYPMPPVVMISNKSGVSEAAAAMKRGAADFVDKKDVDRILSAVTSQLRMGKLLHEKSEQYPLKGSSPATERLRDLIMRWARSSASVLIVGETGTGKEAVARALHFYSPRNFDPFVVVNCPALPESLVESELFGHVKGAFTDAKTDHEGAFERAKGGVLYLAEVGDLPAKIQTKLLQVLSDGQAQRLGANKPYKINSRLIAATNKNPKEFLRQDFYERLAEVVIEVPPLRERRQDIPEIVEYWTLRLCSEEKVYRGIAPEALELLKQADWPGNVRELIRFLRQLIVLGKSGAPITAEEIRHHFTGESLIGRDPFDPNLSYGQAQILFDRELLSRRLQAFDGVKNNVARSLGIGRTTLYEKLHLCGLG